MAAAASHANMEMLQYMYQHKPFSATTDILGYAVMSRNFEIVRWVHNSGDRGDSDMLLMAVQTAVHTCQIASLSLCFVSTSGNPFIILHPNHVVNSVAQIAP